jgi:hypothetical protein
MVTAAWHDMTARLRGLATRRGSVAVLGLGRHLAALAPAPLAWHGGARRSCAATSCPVRPNGGRRWRRSASERSAAPRPLRAGRRPGTPDRQKAGAGSLGPACGPLAPRDYAAGLLRSSRPPPRNAAEAVCCGSFFLQSKSQIELRIGFGSAARVCVCAPAPV